MPFVPIEAAAYVALHLKNNPADSGPDLLSRLESVLAARRAGAVCDCGNPIWVIGSAVAGHACFTCITGKATPDGDYEILEACEGYDV